MCVRLCTHACMCFDVCMPGDLCADVFIWKYVRNYTCVHRSMYTNITYHIFCTQNSLLGNGTSKINVFESEPERKITAILDKVLNSKSRNKIQWMKDRHLENDRNHSVRQFHCTVRLGSNRRSF